MEELYESSKARAIGVSNFSCRKLEDLLAVARVPPAANQVECHPVWQQPKLRNLCRSNGVHLSAYAPLGSPESPGERGAGRAEPPCGGVRRREAAEDPCPGRASVGRPDGAERASQERQRGLDEGEHRLVRLVHPRGPHGQVRLFKYEFVTYPTSFYKSVEDFWDGEV
ncbi:hypothetical protein ACQ4PT_058575 [Festuca glaucescens]